jgi:hypothetical protein
MTNILDPAELGIVASEIGVFEWPQSTALSATAAELPIGVIGPGSAPIAFGAIQIHPNTTYTASDSNYWTVQVYKRTAGGAGVLLAQGSSSVSLTSPIAFTQWVASSLVLSTGAGSFVSPGDVITGVVTKTGTPAALSFYLAGFFKII